MKSKFKIKILFFLVIFLFFRTALLAESLTLGESIKIALEKNPQILVAREKVKVTSALLGQAFATVLPHLRADGYYGRSYQAPFKTQMTIPGMGPMTFSSTPDETARIAGYTLSLSQVLFLGGRDWLAIDIGHTGYKITLEDLKRTENEIIFNVTLAYFEVLKAEQLLAVVKEVVGNLNKHLKQTQIFYQTGLATKADVLRVEAELANMKQNEILAENGGRLAKIAFNNLLCKKLTEEVALWAALPAKDEKEPGLENIIALAFKHRPEWQAFLLGKKISQNLIGFAYSGFLPNLLLTGSWGKTVTEYPNAEKKYDLDSWRLTLLASWNIFDGLESLNKVKEAQANFDAIKAHEKLIQDGINLEVTAAYLNLASARERVAAAQLASEVARKSLRFAEVNYKSNIGTSLAVLDAEAAFDKAATNLSSAKFDLEIARAKINKVVGKKVF